jgi:hypothetical protein
MTEFNQGDRVKVTLTVEGTIHYINGESNSVDVEIPGFTRHIEYIPVEFVTHIEEPVPAWFPPRRGDVINVDGVEFYIRRGNLYWLVAVPMESGSSIRLDGDRYLKEFAQRDLELIRRR